MPVYWYKYRDDLWKKVTIYNAFRDNFEFRYDNDISEKIDTPNERAACNIRRAARQIEAYALCNDWDWFGTFTLDKSLKIKNRKDLDAFRSSFMQFIRNLRQTYGSLEVLLVPELHKNKDGWHMHGLIKGIPKDALRLFMLSERLPKYIRKKLKEGLLVYDWGDYRKRFGFVDIEPIRSRDAASRYITKYLTKDITNVTAQELKGGKHLYFHTRGLVLPERMENAPGCYPEAFSSNLVPVANGLYKWDYGEVQWYERPQSNSNR